MTSFAENRGPESEERRPGRLVVVMGVAGCGKTTTGRALAEALGLPFHDADDYHPAENRAKMARDVPLDDADREPWLRLLAGKLAAWEAEGGTVLACSALKERYRKVLRSEAGAIVFVHLAAPREVIAERLRLRIGRHAYVTAFDGILEGQYRDLEPPGDAIEVDARLPPAEQVEVIRRELAKRFGRAQS